jgi:hypothetical protein
MRKFILSGVLLFALAGSALAGIGRYAVIDNTGTVTNVVEWDGVATWSPPAGSTVVPLPAGSIASIGWTYAAGVFTAPN